MAAATVVLVPEFRGVLRERFLLGSDILTSLLMVNCRSVVDPPFARSHRCCRNVPSRVDITRTRHGARQAKTS